MIKGTMLTTTTSFIKKEFGESAQEEWLASLDDETRYAFQFALATSWYPLELFWTGGMAAFQRFASNRLIETTRKWGEHAAETQLTGIYRLMLKMGSPNTMISAAPRTWGTFHNEGSLSAVVNQKGHGVLRVEGLSLREPLFGETLAGWMHEALHLAGARSIGAMVTKAPRVEENIFEFSLNWS